MTQKLPAPVKIVPEQVQSLRNNGDSYLFKKAELDFLKEYSTCLDEDLALSRVNVAHQRKSEILENLYVQNEMHKIQRAWRYRSRMTQEHAAGEHMRLSEKFENDYDELELNNKSKMAGVLAKMSEATMKATGLIGTERDQSMPTVIVQMNMGSPENVDVTINSGDKNNA